MLIAFGPLHTEADVAAADQTSFLATANNLGCTGESLLSLTNQEAPPQRHLLGSLSVPSTEHRTRDERLVLG